MSKTLVQFSTTAGGSLASVGDHLTCVAEVEEDLDDPVKCSDSRDPEQKQEQENGMIRLERSKTRPLSGEMLLSGVSDLGSTAGSGSDPTTRPQQTLSLLMASVNMGNAAMSPSDLNALIPEDGGNAYDAIVLGMQEAMWDHRSESERMLDVASAKDSKKSSSNKVVSDENPHTTSQKTRKSKRVSTEFIAKISAKLRGLGHSQNESENQFNPRPQRTSSALPALLPTRLAHTVSDTSMLHDLLAKHLPSYTPIIRYQRGEMRLHVYLRSALVPALTDVEVIAENTGIGHVLANKGGIAARVSIGPTSLSFISCHISAHEGEDHYKRRCADLVEILNGCKMGGTKRYDASVISHHTFLCGDLNFRSDFGNKKSNTDVCMRYLRSGAYDKIFGADELRRGMKRGDCLVSFHEGDCSAFAPTFKVRRGIIGGNPELEEYNTQRTPSYCDRILWTSLDGFEKDLTNLTFKSVKEYISSDHKPVMATFTVDLGSAKAPLLPRHFIGDPIDDNDDEDFFGDSGGLEKRRCVLKFYDMKASDLTEMDSQLVGGGSDPFIQFVPLNANLFSSKHISTKRTSRTMSSAGGYFSRFPQTSVIRHNCNPDWKEEIVEIESKPIPGGWKGLSASFLALTFMDHDDLSEDDLIGTVVVNLGALESRAQTNGLSNNSSQNSVRERCNSGEDDKNDDSDWKDITVELKRDLLRNGKRQGEFECKVDVKWAPREFTRNSSIRIADVEMNLHGGSGACCEIS